MKVDVDVMLTEMMMVTLMLMTAFDVHGGYVNVGCDDGDDDYDAAYEDVSVYVDNNVDVGVDVHVCSVMLFFFFGDVLDDHVHAPRRYIIIGARVSPPG